MNEIGEALGTAAEGALYGRAVEPKRGEAAAPDSNGHTHEGACLNCGTVLIGPHCHGCGQRAHVHRTIGAFLHDLLHGALHFEGKTFRTLPLLAWKPGELTRRYIAGERARFVSPMALFLFSVFLMFAVFQLAGISAPDNLGPPVQISEGESSAEAARIELDELRKARAELDEANPAATILDAQIQSLERRTEGGGYSGMTIKRIDTGVPLIDKLNQKWRANPGLMVYKLQANSYKFSWLLIPLSIPFVWLLFAWRRRFGAYDHAVFVTYSLSFMTLLYVVLVLLGAAGIGTGALFMAGVLIPPYHIYRQLKGAYGLSRFSALWRTTVLCGFIMVVLMLFLNLLLLLGAMG